MQRRPAREICSAASLPARPPPIIWITYSRIQSDRDDDLTEVRATLKIGVSVSRLLKAKYAIDYGSNLVLRDGAIHIFEQVSRADVNSLQTNVFLQNIRGSNVASGSRQRSHQRDPATGPYRAQRFVQCSGPASFNHDVYAPLATEIPGRLLPFRIGFVIDRFIRAELPRAFEFLIVTRC